MRVITESNQVLGGADAILYLLRLTWWTWPLYAVSFLPGMKPLFRALYRFIAARRNCISGACKITEHSHREMSSMAWLGWTPLFIFPAAVLPFQIHMPAWVFMWTLSFAVFFGFKWLTMWQAHRRFPKSDTMRLFLYLFLWPGMDAESFIDNQKPGHEPKEMEWVFAAAKFLLGGFLFWGVARSVPVEWPLLRGWIGLFGLIFLLHFGSFHLLTLFWQRMGMNVSPIMKAPILSASLSEFWNHRWNLAFRQLANRIAFQPLHKRFGTMGAMSIAFLGSGLLHELVISLPARGGYGLPTIYFMLQAAGMAFERSSIGRKMGLAAGFKGWIFTMIVAAGPAFWLFHPPFVKLVVIPFMEAMHAL